MQTPSAHDVIGWREWAGLPNLGIKLIKAKVDTGAKTSSLHAFKVEPFTEKGIQKVRFLIHPLQRRLDKVVCCEARVVDFRSVSDSGGHTQKRYVIETSLCLGDQAWPIELTLFDRETMKFRLLLGRQAFRKNHVIDPRHSYLAGKPLTAPSRKKKVLKRKVLIP